MKKPNVLRCISCGKELDHEQGPEGVYLRGCGNYASSVFDDCDMHPYKSVFLEVIVCDACLRRHHDRVWHVTRGDPPPEKYKPFTEVLEQRSSREQDRE